MRKARIWLKLVAVFLVLGLILPGCSGGGGGGSAPGSPAGANPTPTFTPVAQFSPGIRATVASASIGPTGGTLSVPQGNPVAGVSVNFPAGALVSTTTVSLGYDTGTLSTVRGTASGANLVLTVPGVTTFAQPVTITVPFDSAKGTPIPYYIDSAGLLHPAQLITINSANGTAMFQTFHASIFTWVMDVLGLGDSNVVTAFLPGNDGFKVANIGSTYNRQGECFGMTSFSLWYLENAKAGEGNFFPRFMDAVGTDSTGSTRLGQNVIATRAFISIAQQWNAYLPTITRETNLTDTQNYNIVRNSLVNTQNPVILYLYHKNGVPAGAHSVLAYGYNNSGLLVYDVNLPNQTVNIGYDSGTGKLGPYGGYDGIIYNGDGSLHVTESYSSILADAKAGFHGNADSTVNVTSHTSGQTVTSRIVNNFVGTVQSGQVMVSKLTILVGSTEYATDINADGSFSTAITLDRGVNHLTFLTWGKDANGQFIYVPTGMDTTDFTLIGDFAESVIFTTLTWDTNNTDIDTYVIDPTGDYSSYFHKTTADGGFLDYDITTGYGPEHWLLTSNNTVRWGQAYRMRLHYYSDKGNGPSNYTVSIQIYEGADAITTYYRGNLAASDPDNSQPSGAGADWVDIATVVPVQGHGPPIIRRQPGGPVIITVPVPPAGQRRKR